MWLQEVIKCNKIVILNVSSLSEALVHLKEENISRGAGTMKMKMMQIIKENHLPPRLPDKADPGCCSPTFTINLINFLLNECNGLSSRSQGLRSSFKRVIAQPSLLLWFNFLTYLGWVAPSHPLPSFKLGIFLALNFFHPISTFSVFLLQIFHSLATLREKSLIVFSNCK